MLSVSSVTKGGCGVVSSFSTGVPLGSVVVVVLWAARFLLCPLDGLPSRCPSASLGMVHILPLGVVAGMLGDLRTSGEVLAAKDPGFLPPWVLGVPVRLGSGTCPGGVLSGGRAAGGGRTRTSTFDEAARTVGRPGPKRVSTRGQG